jgi:transcription elongation GreA/GreB family factor
MSRAFIKEDDAGLPEELPERPVSPHQNLVTPEGLAAIEAEIARLTSALQTATASEDQHAIAVAQRDLRYWAARRANAEMIEPPQAPSRVQFGVRVTLARDDGRTQVFRIVGEDEADPAHGSISHVSPLARALFGKEAGDVVEVAGRESEILQVE